MSNNYFILNIAAFNWLVTDCSTFHFIWKSHYQWMRIFILLHRFRRGTLNFFGLVWGKTLIWNRLGNVTSIILNSPEIQSWVTSKWWTLLDLNFHIKKIYFYSTRIRPFFLVLPLRIFRGNPYYFGLRCIDILKKMYLM